jgi:hypothetical protein
METSMRFDKFATKSQVIRGLNYFRTFISIYPEKMEKTNIENRGWLRRLLHWISQGAVKSVNSSGFCST